MQDTNVYEKVRFLKDKLNWINSLGADIRSYYQTNHLIALIFIDAQYEDILNALEYKSIALDKLHQTTGKIFAPHLYRPYSELLKNGPISELECYNYLKLLRFKMDEDLYEKGQPGQLWKKLYRLGIKQTFITYALETIIGLLVQDKIIELSPYSQNIQARTVKGPKLKMSYTETSWNFEGIGKINLDKKKSIMSDGQYKMGVLVEELSKGKKVSLRSIQSRLSDFSKYDLSSYRNNLNTRLKLAKEKGKLSKTILIETDTNERGNPKIYVNCV